MRRCHVASNILIRVYFKNFRLKLIFSISQKKIRFQVNWLGGKSVGETSELFLETAHNGSLIVNEGRITQVPVIVKEAAVKVRQMAPMLCVCSSIDRLQSNQGPTDGAE